MTWSSWSDTCFWRRNSFIPGSFKDHNARHPRGPSRDKVSDISISKSSEKYEILSYPLYPNIYPAWIQKQPIETPQKKIDNTHGWLFRSAVKAQQRKYQEIWFIHGSTNSWPRKNIFFVLHQFSWYLCILGGCFCSKKTPNLTWFSCVQSCFFVRYHQVPALFQNTIPRCDIGLAFCDTLEWHHHWCSCLGTSCSREKMWLTNVHLLLLSFLWSKTIYLVETSKKIVQTLVDYHHCFYENLYHPIMKNPRCWWFRNLFVHKLFWTNS